MTPVTRKPLVLEAAKSHTEDMSNARPTPNEALAAEGLDWTAPAVEVYDTLLYAGYTHDQCETLVGRYLR